MAKTSAARTKEASHKGSPKAEKRESGAKLSKTSCVVGGGSSWAAGIFGQHTQYFQQRYSSLARQLSKVPHSAQAQMIRAAAGPDTLYASVGRTAGEIGIAMVLSGNK